MAQTVEVKLTEKLKSALEQAVQNESTDKATLVEFKQAIGNESKLTEKIAFSTVRKLKDVLSNQGEKVYLHELLSGSELHLEPPESPKRNPELVKRIEQLKVEQANKEYNRMVGNVTIKDDPLDFSIGEDVKALNRQLTSVFNFILTVVAAFVFGYKGSDILLGVSNIPEKFIYGLFLGTVVFFADLYFLVRNSD